MSDWFSATAATPLQMALLAARIAAGGAVPGPNGGFVSVRETNKVS